MKIIRYVAYMALGLLVLLSESTGSKHPNSSRSRWRARGDALRDFDSQENEVIKTGQRKKQPVKSHQTTTTTTPARETSRNEDSNNNNANAPEIELDANTLNKLQWFRNTDRNEDSYVSKKEYARTHSTTMFEASIIFQTFDKDGDGFISQIEFIQATANAVGTYEKPEAYPEKRDCSVELLNACAVNLIRFVIKGRGKVGCSKLKTFQRCVVRKSRKCNHSTRRQLQTLSKEMFKSISIPQSCRVRTKIQRSRHAKRRQDTKSNDKTSCSPVQVMKCSKVLLRSLTSSKKCHSLRRYKNCVRKTYRQCARPIRMRLRYSVRTVRKSYRRFRECP